jgi:hypothetical protein
MKHILLLTTLFFALSSAHAESGSDPSEFLFQAKGGQSFIQGNINYLSHNSDPATSGGPKLEVTDKDLTARYEMGLSDMMSVYGSVGFGQADVKVGPFSGDLNGINPVNLGMKYRMAAGPGQFYAQGNLGLGLFEKNNDTRMDGSMNLSARLGYLMSYESASSGLVLDLGLFSTDGEDESTGNDIKHKKGLALTAFYEMLSADMVYGLAVTYGVNMFPTSPSTSGLSGLFPEDESEASLLDLKIYTRVPMSEHMHLLGSVNYSTILDQTDPGFDGGDNLGVNIGLRYLM